MDPSSQNQQRRQFGRRQTQLSAIAAVPGRGSVACDVLNLSEGGALLTLADKVVPTRPFRLTVDAAMMTLLCEVRHSGPQGIGVRFLNPADGQALIASLYPGPSAHAASELEAAPARIAEIATQPLSNRALRQSMLDSQAEKQRAEAASLPAPPPHPPARRMRDTLFGWKRPN